MLRVEAEAELGMLKLFLVCIAYELNDGRIYHIVRSKELRSRELKSKYCVF
jgi:hypothetical protein